MTEITDNSNEESIDIRIDNTIHIFLPRRRFKGFATRLDNGRFYIALFGAGEIEYNTKTKWLKVISILRTF